MRIFMRLWNGLRKLIGLILPIFGKARDFRAISRPLRVILHILVLAVTLVLLFSLNWVIPGLQNLCRVQSLRQVWLPVLFLIIYTLGWLVRWGWMMWMTEEEASDFPDIDRAWAEAMRALAEAGIDLQEVPVFLVLGRPAAGENCLFDAAQLPFSVKSAPPYADAPLHIYANRQDGIFITCTRISRLGLRAALLALRTKMAVESPPEDLPETSEIDVTETIRPSAINKVRPLFQILEQARKQGRGPAEMTAEEQEMLRLIERSEKPEEAQLLSARLEHLCRLIVRGRRPDCPLNGILVLLPFAALGDDEDAEKTRTDCRTDLQTAWEVFQLHCPLFTLVCDLETVPGFPQYLEGYLAQYKSEEDRRKSRKRRLGRHFGWGLGLENSSRESMIKEHVEWIGHGMFPIQVYENSLRLVSSEGDDPERATHRNGQLFRFLGALREGQKRLTELVVHGLASKPKGPALLRGCYLAATGRDSAREQAFVAGVFQRLLEYIRYVSWTQEALAEDAAYHRRASYGYLALPIYLIVLILLLGLYMWHPWAP
jgi:hypothetical protein